MGVTFDVECRTVKHRPPPNATQNARRLRRDMTRAERAIWRLLREAFPEARFHRQVPIRHYIVDFASHRSKLVIEVDGGQHCESADAERTRLIEEEGYRLIRFWNNDVLGNAQGVWTIIDRALHDRHPHPASPIKGEGLTSAPPE